MTRVVFSPLAVAESHPNTLSDKVKQSFESDSHWSDVKLALHDWKFKKEQDFLLADNNAERIMRVAFRKMPNISTVLIPSAHVTIGAQELYQRWSTWDSKVISMNGLTTLPPFLRALQQSNIHLKDLKIGHMSENARSKMLPCAIDRRSFADLQHNTQLTKFINAKSLKTAIPALTGSLRKITVRQHIGNACTPLSWSTLTGIHKLLAGSLVAEDLRIHISRSNWKAALRPLLCEVLPPQVISQHVRFLQLTGFRCMAANLTDLMRILANTIQCVTLNDIKLTGRLDNWNNAITSLSTVPFQNLRKFRISGKNETPGSSSHLASFLTQKVTDFSLRNGNTRHSFNIYLSAPEEVVAASSIWPTRRRRNVCTGKEHVLWNCIALAAASLQKMGVRLVSIMEG